MLLRVMVTTGSLLTSIRGRGSSSGGSHREGSFPKKQMKLLDAWMTIHEDELKANWKMLSEGDGFFKIDPLR